MLVVEDDPGIAGVLRRGLALHGLEVEVALDGTDARAAWAGAIFDLIVLDVMLPGVDGVELLAERRAAGDLTPVILLTARDDDRVRARGLAVGADAFVVKPFDYSELVALIDRLGSRSIVSSDSISGA